MDGIMNVLSYILSNKKALIYTTFIQEEYYKAASKLSAEGVEYRVATLSNTPSVGSPAHRYDYNVEFKFYVRKVDRHKAEEAIHR
ncbi:hypothetical protein GLV98_01825 [Halobacillus litoralis]|uniref:DUF2007 domain-containing protein n=1 Tax=Halobacillus litoralis TaxID=45668 RepID=A0A845EA82_9BACI|nr:hypothetical protein [Halobacillus litoralis]MYL48198.1 hypothetical protein [Halobacillus litoralis]